MNTRTFDRLPEELLNLTFQKLNSQDLIECQKVCRSWKLPAHVLLLQEVRLINKLDVRQFLACIKCIRDPIYLAAVKKLTVGDYRNDSARIEFGKKLFEKVIASLPQLRTIVIEERQMMTNYFIDPILKYCPNLESLYISPIDMSYSTSRLYCQFLLRLPLLRHVTLPYDADEILPEGALKFLSHFEHLSEVNLVFSQQFCELSALLPLFEQQSNIQSITFRLCPGDRITDVVTENALVIDRLAKLKELTVQASSGFYPNTIKFFNRYLTGVKRLKLYLPDHQEWGDEEKETYRGVFDFVSNVPKFDIRADLTGEEPFVGCVSFLLDRFFQKNTTENVLHLTLQTSEFIEPRPFSQVGIRSVHDARPKRVIDLAMLCRVQDDLLDDELLHLLFPIKHVDTLVITFDEVDEIFEGTVEFSHLVRHFLTGVTAVQKVKLVFYILPYLEDEPCYPLVTSLELEVMSGTGPPDDIILMFPNLKYLSLRYFCGDWNIREERGVCRIDVKTLKLERLHLDMTPLRVVAGELLTQEIDVVDAFLVLEVMMSNKYRLYKVFFDYLRVTPIEEEPRGGLKCGEDYIKLSINISELEYLDLHINSRTIESEHYVRYFDDFAERIISVKVPL